MDLGTLPEESARLIRTAHEHLPPDLAEQWTGLLRPTLKFRHGDDADPAVAHRGGEPLMPPDMPWPTWDGEGPLSLIAGFDLGALPRGNLNLPDSGLLYFFLFDGQVCESTMPSLDGVPEAHRVLHIPAGTTVRRRTPPDVLRPVSAEPLTVSVEFTAPSQASHVLEDQFDTTDARVSEALYDGDFHDALDLWEHLDHQLGGYPFSPQNPSLWDIVGDESLQTGPGQLEAWQAECRQWLTLAQFPPDYRSALWCSDTGYRYWYIRREDLDARRFDRAAFAWQDT
ncbi:MAG TPA: YwqG family protein [Yinghuangia sp.]|nr:YwqG family protein [Yinghuangia sp.]